MDGLGIHESRPFFDMCYLYIAVINNLSSRLILIFASAATLPVRSMVLLFPSSDLACSATLDALFIRACQRFVDLH